MDQPLKIQEEGVGVPTVKEPELQHLRSVCFQRRGERGGGGLVHGDSKGIARMSDKTARGILPVLSWYSNNLGWWE